MKIEKSEHYIVEKDGVDFIRLGENNWIFLLGNTWESIDLSVDKGFRNSD